MTDMPEARDTAYAGTVSGASYIYYGVTTVFNNDCREYIADAWTNKTDGPSPNRFLGAGSSDGSFCYATAGVNSSFSNIVDHDQFDPSGNSWASKTDLPAPSRQEGRATGILGKIYAMGGVSGSQLADNDEYDPSGDSWTEKTDLPTPARGRHSAFTLNNDRGYIAGGTGTALLVDIDEYDSSGNSWAAKTNMPSPARDIMSFHAAPSGVNGWLSNGQAAASARIRDHDAFVDNGWTSHTDTPLPARQYGVAANS
jgi:hypothetical protein